MNRTRRKQREQTFNEEFKAKSGESLEDTYERFVSLLNELAKNKVKKKQIENNVKFLSVLQPEWKKHTRRMKQMKDLSEIPLHEFYETLRQNKEEVEEKREEKKEKEKTVPDPVALVIEKKKEKEKKDKKKKKKVVLTESEESNNDDSDSDDGENMKQAMLLMTRVFQKKFYQKPGSNSQLYSSGSRNYEHKERIERKWYEERKPEEKKYVNNYEKKYVGKSKDAGKALMVEDDHWLDFTDTEGEREENAHMCLMGKEVKFDESDEETSEEVNIFSESNFLMKMETMMVELQDLQAKLKKEKRRVAKKRQTIFDLNKEIVGNKNLIDSLNKVVSAQMRWIQDHEDERWTHNWYQSHAQKQNHDHDHNLILGRIYQEHAKQTSDCEKFLFRTRKYCSARSNNSHTFVCAKQELADQSLREPQNTQTIACANQERVYLFLRQVGEQCIPQCFTRSVFFSVLREVYSSVFCVKCIPQCFARSEQEVIILVLCDFCT
ncbi:hypothetical protein L6452_09431 [Arctium lappa]|uniref:Uncharacterized protein n=1 Tax=Arctium lappa TaxID=4217 RepID=A0ACB9DK11_ARCLA|nr:hypothetical protein L6452_09431 [Arctium lappa]